MRALPFLAALLCTAPLAEAKSELELLQDRCSEQERQIRQLELENSQLKSLVTTATKTPAPIEHAKTETKAAPASEPSFGIVRSGDTLSKVAKRHGTTTATLIKLNKLTNPSLIRPGQKLRLPDKDSGPSAAPAPSKRGTHVVKSGETFYSIARQYGLSPETLQAANPTTKASNLRPGQTLTLGAKSEAAVARKSTAKAAPQPKAEAPAPKQEEMTSQTVASTPRIHSISIDRETDFGAFAAAHGTSTAKLNALNGLNLNPSTVLAKGSELYVPAQP